MLRRCVRVLDRTAVIDHLAPSRGWHGVRVGVCAQGCGSHRLGSGGDTECTDHSHVCCNHSPETVGTTVNILKCWR